MREPRRGRSDQCDDCKARLMFVRHVRDDRTLGGWIACDATVDLAIQVAPSIAFRFDHSRGHRIGFTVTPHRHRPDGWRMTTVHAATCSAARRRNVPANQRPVGRDDMTNDPTLFEVPRGR